jgi:DNA-binding transcriptional ArsR family regulator
MKTEHPPIEVCTLRESASKACSLLKVLTNEDRLIILCHLTEGERSVSEIKDSANILQPILSQQLMVLRQEKIVTTRKKGKYIYYSLASPEIIQIMQSMSKLYCKN